MERRAAIIYCPSTQGGALPGPQKDFKHYNNFLQSSAGGNWRTEEIRGLLNPTKKSVDGIVNNFLKGANYTFIVFTGHGVIQGEDQILEVSDGFIRLANLSTGALRQTVIVDACRERVFPQEDLVENARTAVSHFDEQSTRELFDQAIEQSGHGILRLYACSPGQTAGDTLNGAIYSSRLIAGAINWYNDRNNETLLTLNDAHNLVARELTGTDQTPTIDKTSLRFPFSVKLPIGQVFKG